MTLDEWAALWPKVKRSERGRVDWIKRTRPDDDASFVVGYTLKETGTPVQLSSPEDWPLSRSLA